MNSIKKEQKYMDNIKYHGIASENSCHHWKPFDVTGCDLLDLGCGRHCVNILEETSPIWLGRNANSVLGVDGSQSEINYFNDTNPDTTKFSFICSFVDSSDKVKELLKGKTAVKCDIEEHEVHFYPLTKEDMKDVKTIAIEYHTQEIRTKMIEKFIEWGFEIHTEAKFEFVNAPQMGVLFGTKYDL